MKKGLVLLGVLVLMLCLITGGFAVKRHDPLRKGSWMEKAQRRADSLSLEFKTNPKYKHVSTKEISYPTESQHYEDWGITPDEQKVLEAQGARGIETPTEFSDEVFEAERAVSARGITSQDLINQQDGPFIGRLVVLRGKRFPDGLYATEFSVDSWTLDFDTTAKRVLPDSIWAVVKILGEISRMDRLQLVKHARVIRFYGKWGGVGRR
jgi:hypothetical protein